MLAPDVQIVDIDGRHLTNWYDLLVPPRLNDDFRVVAIFLDTGAPIKAIVRGRGSLPLERIPFTGTDRAALQKTAAALDAEMLVVMERTALAEIVAQAERELHLSDDYVGQALTFARALATRRGAGIWSEPPILELIPPVSYEPLQRTFDALIPDNSSMLAYVFDDDRRDIHASLIAVKRKGHVDLVSTHLGIEDELAGTALASDWRKSYRRLVRLVGERYEKPSVAAFLSRAAWRRILLGPPDQIGREMSRRDVILDPAPAWLLGLLGSATMAAVAGRGAKALARMLPLQTRKMASRLASTAQSVMRESGAHPFALLGFDPIALWHQVRRMYRPTSDVSE